MSDKRIERIKKLLALAKSSNEHEAANALRLAQKLMKELELSEQDIALTEIKQQHTKRANASDKQPLWATRLTNTICAAFGLEAILSWDRDLGATVIFIGPADRVTIGIYCYEVLAPQLVKARKAYLLGLNKRLKLTTKTNRADLFAEGWIAAVRSKVESLVPSEEEKNLVELYKEKHFPHLVSTPTRAAEQKKRDVSAFYAGAIQGKNIRLNAGVSGAGQAKIGSR